MNAGLWFAIASSLFCMHALPGYGAYEREASTVTVVLCEQTGLNVTTLQAAKHRTAYIFRRASIEIKWLSGCESMPALPSYLLVVLSKQSPPGWASPAAMGFAPVRTGDRRRAYVFLDRVKLFVEFTSPKDRRSSVLGMALGCAIAHEIGHLLIPGDSHSVHGIMSPSWSITEWRDALTGTLVFFPEQARTMQKTLNELTLPAMSMSH